MASGTLEGMPGSVRDSGKFKAEGTRNPPQGLEIVESSQKVIGRQGP